MDAKTELIVYTLIQNAVSACQHKYHANGRATSIVEVVQGLLVVWDNGCYHYEILNVTSDATFTQAINHVYEYFGLS